MEYGNQSESLAIKTLENIIKIQIKKCGLFIDDDVPYLAATPGNSKIYNTIIILVLLLTHILNVFITQLLDGLIDDDAIVEIKCPYSVKDYHTTLEEAEKKVSY